MPDTIDHVARKLREVTVQESNVRSLFVGQDIQGRGKALVAATKIPAQTLVLAEAPLLKLEMEVDDETEINEVINSFQKLGARDQAAYLKLSEFTAEIYRSQPSWKSLSDEHKRVIAVWGANNWNDMVFEIGCRINHACAPNLETSWNERSGKQIWIAVRDIEIGEELTGTYIYDIESHSTKYRKEELRKYWGFDCGCGACAGNLNVLEGKIELGE